MRSYNEKFFEDTNFYNTKTVFQDTNYTAKK